MTANADDGAKGEPQGEAPGALSRLLDELARAPQADPGGAWGKALRPGDVLDRFEILRELGRGGFGAVYEALDRDLGRKVALKTLRPGRSRDEWSDEALRREAQAAASLSHPGIVTLHEACTCDRGPYLVMELLRGETLESRLARGPMPHADAVEVALQMARALGHVHGHGLVHRDLKPGNVFLGDDGRVKLLDLGLAHLLGRKSSTGGTPAYVAPEQWRGEEVDGRADVFALGAVLFEMVSGRRAFEVKEERSSALDAGPAPALGGKAPRGLARLVARCLSKEPSRRPTAAQTAEELLGIQRRLARPRAFRRVGLLLGAGVLVGIAFALVALQASRKGGGTAPDGRVVVAVADVVNETGEKELDVLSGLLVTSLEQSRKLSVMTQARVLDLAIRSGRKDAARVDETIGREVGAAHGVRALLLPAIRKLGGTYSLEMRAVDPGHDEHLFTLADRATSKEALLDLLDRLSERTRTELGEPREEVGKTSVQLGEAMTRSLDAYQHYLSGLESWLQDGQRAAGLREFQEALRLDPGFAAAHAQIATLLHNSYDLPGLAGPHWEAADAGLDRMPEKERLLYRLMRAHKASTFEHFDREEALRLADEVLARFPGDKIAIASAGDAFETFDLPDRWEPALRRALALDPGQYWAAALLVSNLSTRTGEALEVARRAVATRRTPANLSILAPALWATGDEDGAIAAAREILGSDGRQHSLLASRACEVLRERGHGRECLPVWTWMAEEGLNAHERDFARARLMDGLAHQGRIREALRLARTNPDFVRVVRPEWLARILVVGRHRADAKEALEAGRRISWPQGRRNWLAWLGAFDEAERVDATLQGKGYPMPDRIFAVLRLERQGKYAEAAEQMGAIQADLLRRNNGQLSFVHAYYRAELLLAAGRREDAAAVRVELAPCRCTDGLDQADGFPKLALVRARAMEQLGRRADAIRELDGILSFWNEADQDLPLLVEAKGMRRRLAARPAADDAVRAARADSKVEASTPSIAVLPFADLSPGKDQEYFADGVAEEILNALTHVRGLKVAGRTSSFSFKGRRADLRTIGRRLGVVAVLEGSVRKDGDRVRVTAQLVKAEDGFHLWSERYDRELTGIFAVQDEIARMVVAKVAPLLAGKPRADPRTALVTSPEAYDAYLVGLELLRHGKPEAYRRAVAAAEKAIALDPSFGPAWAALARGRYQLALMSDIELSAVPRALDAANKAVELAPGQAAGLSARAPIRCGLWDWNGGRADAEHALELEPDSADAHRRYGSILLEMLGAAPSHAMEHLERAANLDPLDPAAWNALGIAMRVHGDLEGARRAIRRALELDPQHESALWNLGYIELAGGHLDRAVALWRRSAHDTARLSNSVKVEFALGHPEASRANLERLAREHGDRHPLWVAQGHAFRGEKDLAFEWLEKAAAKRHPNLRWVKIDFWLTPLHSDPRWKALLRKMNLPVD